MLITAITHAAARSSDSYNFRGLTDQGQQEARSAAKHYRKTLSRLANFSGRQIPAVEAVVSSPKPRCLETVILFAKDLADLMTAGEVEVEAGIKAGDVQGGELAELAQRFQVDHLLVSGHADMVKMIPEETELMPEAADGGWFNDRPILFVIDYDRAQDWSEAKVLACEGLVDGAWQGLLAP